MRLQQANLLFAASAATTATLAAVRSINDNIGLSLSNLNADGVAVGFLPAWGEPMSPNDPTSLNRLLPRPMAVIGAYAQVQANDPNLSQVDKYVNSTLQQAGNPPLALALMPDGGLGSITQAVANRIAQKMLAINRMGIKVWLRYAHEMNGDWYAWGQQPAAFLQSWNMVTNAVRAVTNDTFMLWAPNEMYASSNDVADPRGGYSAYWPGSSMVDIVGLSFYHYGGHDRLNNMPPADEALKVMQRFDRLFGTPQNRPFVLAETGAAYTRLLPSGQNAPGNASESAIKVDWLHQLTGPDTLTALPSLKAITWFEVLKDENAGYGTDIKREDFRIISQPNSTLATYTLGYMNNITKDADVPAAGVAGASSSNSSAAAAASPNVTTSAKPSASAKSGAIAQYSSTHLLSLASLLACSGLALLL